jgi:hypothetical protein
MRCFSLDGEKLAGALPAVAQAGLLDLPRAGM